MEINKERINKNLFENIELLTKQEVKEAMDYVIEKIDQNLDLYTDNFPSACTTNQFYRTKGNDDWTNGFWTAMIWLAYDYTGDEKYKKVAKIHCESFYKRLENHFVLDHHDLGFLYTLSTVADYKITADEKSKKNSIWAAEKLLDRYHENGRFIQAWGKKGDANEYRMIIDCLFNLPLLYWASEEAGDEKFKVVADNHFETAINILIRDDASTYHTHYFDVETGKPTKGITHQGFADDSSWARGQAWAIYGMPLNFKYNKHEKNIYLYERVLNYFLNRLPEDLICYWDLIFTEEDKQFRDSSAAAIVACGILEMDGYIKEHENKEVYVKAAHGMIRSLINKYTTKDMESNGILKEGVYSWHNSKGINECNLWGDYFYMEALMRIYKEKDLMLYW